MVLEKMRVLGKAWKEEGIFVSRGIGNNNDIWLM
jgi:hypothetical protein